MRESIRSKIILGEAAIKNDEITPKEALEICEKYGAPTHQQRPWNIIQMAISMDRAYKDGAHNKSFEPELASYTRCPDCGNRRGHRDDCIVRKI